MSGSHRARHGLARWLFGFSLVCALVVPLVLGVTAGSLSVPGTGRPAAPVPTSTTPPRTADSMLRPRGGCPPGFGPTPAIPGVCVSPTPEVVQTRGTTTTRTRTTAPLPRTPTPTEDPP